ASAASVRANPTASWLTRSSAAASYPSRAPQSRLARHVGVSSENPAPWSRASAKNGAKYRRSRSRPSLESSSGNAANSGSSTPSWKTSVVSSPPSVNVSCAPTAPTLLLQPALVPGSGDRERLARVLEVHEQPLAVRRVAAARPLRAPAPAPLLALPLVEVQRRVVARERRDLPGRRQAAQEVRAPVDVLAVAVLADDDPAARRDRQRVGLVEHVPGVRLEQQRQGPLLDPGRRVA